MSRNAITISHSIVINRSPERVWDFTQNYANRSRWDSSVIEAVVLQTTPERIVRLRMRGNTSMSFVYKLDDRPKATTLAARDVQSPVMESGGGSWRYAKQDGGTLWTQTNTIILKKNFFLSLLVPLYRWLLLYQTKAAMQKAKNLIETEST